MAHFDLHGAYYPVAEPEVPPGRVTIRLSRVPEDSLRDPAEALHVNVQSSGMEYTRPVIRFWRDVLHSDFFMALTVQQVRTLVTAVGSMLFFSTAEDSEQMSALWEEFKVVAAIAAQDIASVRPEDRSERLLVPMFIWAVTRHRGAGNAFGRWPEGEGPAFKLCALAIRGLGRTIVCSLVPVQGCADQCLRNTKRACCLPCSNPCSTLSAAFTTLQLSLLRGIDSQPAANVSAISSTTADQEERPMSATSFDATGCRPADSVVVCPESREAATASVQARFALARRGRRDVLPAVMQILARMLDQRTLQGLFQSHILLWDVAELLNRLDIPPGTTLLLLGSWRVHAM
ncbi:hypothetical protein C8T65DRAFT_701408 [Cerioporus squamosus]|nr:hypothetical protein C8T65DRAFT_701408 [Cerioporus squamosus]